MDSQEAIEFIDSLLKKNPQDHKEFLDPLERAIIQGSWERETYEKMLPQVHCDFGHLKNKGAELWKIIGILINRQVSKTSARSVIEAQKAEFDKAPSDEGVRWRDRPDWRKSRIRHPAWPAHTDGIGGLAICPDQPMFASGSWDGAIELWDLETGKSIRTLAAPVQKSADCSEHDFDIAALIFTPNGDRLISASYDRTIKIWELNTGKLLSVLLKDPNRDHPHTFYNHTNWVEALALSDDGQVLASGSFDQTIYLWDLRNLRLIHKLHSDSEILSLAFSPDNEILCGSCQDGTIQIWNLNDRSTTAQKIRVSTGWVASIAISPDSQKIYSGDEFGAIAVTDIQTQTKIDSWSPGHTSAILSLALHPQDSNVLVSSSYDATIVFWNLEGRKSLHDFPPHQAGITSISFNQAGNILVVGDELGEITVWQTTH
jgi:WD40 repeat protein